MSPWILPSGGGGFNPGITHNFPDGRAPYLQYLFSICQSDMHLFQIPTIIIRKNRMFVILFLNDSEFAYCAYGNKEK